MAAATGAAGAAGTAAASLAFSGLTPRLSAESLAAVASLGFSSVTPVQAATIPLFLSHKDVCVEATTGSGKTLAFALPILEILRTRFEPQTRMDVGALVVAPTRELASQIFDVFCTLAAFHSGLRCALLVGGSPVDEAVAQLKAQGVQILVGTPGRVLDVAGRCDVLSWRKLEVLVLDEADTLLDMGFREALGSILALLPKQRRTGLFSATQTQEVKELARVGLRNPVTVRVRVQQGTSASGGKSSQQQPNQATPTTLESRYMVVPHDERPEQLLRFLLAHRGDKVIVFCATCACVDYYSASLARLAQRGLAGLSAATAIVGFHGKMVAKKRTNLYRRFVSLDAGVMFTTDVAARGIDIPDVGWIVQMAAPRDPAFFVHRVGRTARAGRAGGALLFVSPEEAAYIDLLRGRGVPMLETPKAHGPGAAADLLERLKALATEDRDLLEGGSTAFMSFVRAYKEHLCTYIFRPERLDLGALARAYALLRLPKMTETRGRPVEFQSAAVATGSIPYLHPQKEEARQRRLQALRQEESKNEDEQDGKEEDREDGESEEEEDGGKERKKKEWVPADEWRQQQEARINERGHTDEKRKRKKKASVGQKVRSEWDELAAEEMAFKKFKRGKLSRDAYDECLLSDKKIELDSDGEVALQSSNEDEDEDEDEDEGEEERRRGQKGGGPGERKIDYRNRGKKKAGGGRGTKRPFFKPR